MMPRAWNVYFPCRPNTDKNQNKPGGNITLAKKDLRIAFLKGWYIVLLCCSNQIKAPNAEGPHLQVPLTVVPPQRWGRCWGTAAPQRGRSCQPRAPCSGSFADSTKYLLSLAGSDTIFSQKRVSVYNYRLFCELKLLISKFWGARWQQRVFIFFFKY